MDASAWNEGELNKQVTEAYKCPFDFEQGPLLRVNLFTCSEQDYILLLVIHHIVCDGWSLWLLMDELRVLYQAEMVNRKVFLPYLNRQYTDYLQWQTEKLVSEEERLWGYWREQLAGELPVINLPTFRLRPPVLTYRGASYAFKLTKELTQRLKELARTEEATLYMILLAAFYVLLHRYSGQKDILVGSPTAGRDKTEFAGVVGYFVNPVVLRADIS
ncbi:pyoverdine sidechain peptide synthetase III,L-Thr-L-Ser component, partial [Candidatus Thiomargarita nelsonii]